MLEEKKQNRNRWPTYSDLGRAEQELPLAKINRPYRHTHAFVGNPPNSRE
jgi:hypothetical protein